MNVEITCTKFDPSEDPTIWVEWYNPETNTDHSCAIPLRLWILQGEEIAYHD